jgi:hypothetical protein
MATIKTEICDLCLCPSKRNELFDLKISGKVETEKGVEYLKGFVKDEVEVALTFPFNWGIPTEPTQGEYSKKTKRIHYEIEVCEVCAKKLLTFFIALHQRKESELKKLQEMFK